VAINSDSLAAVLLARVVISSHEMAVYVDEVWFLTSLKKCALLQASELFLNQRKQHVAHE
jgi:hypothetical protein